MGDNNKENKMSIDDFDFAHEEANDDTPMLVNYLVTSLQQAMGNPALQGAVQQQLHAYGILPPFQQERGPERSHGETSKRGLSTGKAVENPYQDLKQLLEGKPSSKKKAHVQHEESPSKEREESESQDESMEDVAPRRRKTQRSPTSTKRKRSPHSPHHCESKREEHNSKKKKERKRSPSSPSSSPSSSLDESSGFVLCVLVSFQILYSGSRFVSGSVQDLHLVVVCNWFSNLQSVQDWIRILQQLVQDQDQVFGSDFWICFAIGSGKQVNNQNQTPVDLDSNISIKASVNQKINTPLETIVEDSYSDSSSELSYFEMASSSTKVNFDLGPGYESEFSAKAPDHQLLFLKFQFENGMGAKIYKDGMERYCIKVEDRRGDTRDLVPIIYSGDQYFDDQEFMYIVMLNPNIEDKWEMSGTKEKIDVEPEEAPPALNKLNLKLQRVNDMTRVNTDNIFLGLYKYDGREHTTYYQCKEPLLRELTDEKKLYVFTYGEDAKTDLIMTEKYGRSYVNVGPKELTGYTYFGGPLPNYYFTPLKPKPFARHPESMGYPVFPDPRPILPVVRTMGSFGKTTHLGSGTYSRNTHASEAMSRGGRDAEARSFRRIFVESHSRGTDRQRNMSDRTRMWVDTRPMRPSQLAKCMPKKYGGSGDPYAHVSFFKQVLRAEHWKE
ncbi:hypothetical protein L7F22_067084 [Adiantum nelumboides]|nr:hypothetical protein [Adiantum nelumboides]